MREEGYSEQRKELRIWRVRRQPGDSRHCKYNCLGIKYGGKGVVDIETREGQGWIPCVSDATWSSLKLCCGPWGLWLGLETGGWVEVEGKTRVCKEPGAQKAPDWGPWQQAKVGRIYPSGNHWRQWSMCFWKGKCGCDALDCMGKCVCVCRQ